MTATGVAIGLALWAAAVALFALLRPVESRHGLTMRLSLTLLRYDEGLALLAAHSNRRDEWWRDASLADREHIDRALSMWDLAAWYVATKRVDRRAVLDVFAWQIVDVWERAYPYVQHRRREQPTLWSSLTELYMDALEVAPRPPGPSPWREEPLPHSVSPETVEYDEPTVQVQRTSAAASPTATALVDMPPAAAVDVAPAASVPADVTPLPAIEETPAEVLVETEPPAHGIRDHWYESLRKAGPVLSPLSPVPAGGDLLRLRAALTHLDHPTPVVPTTVEATVDTPPPAAAATNVETTVEAAPSVPRQPARGKPRAPVQHDLGIDQVVDISDSVGATRQHVVG